MPITIFQPTEEKKQQTERSMLGPYLLTRPLVPCALAERWLALHEADQSSHVAYRFPRCPAKGDQRRFMAAVQACAALDHPHILKVEQFSFDTDGRPWLITPFTGDADGIRTLGRLLREKGGQMHPFEAERALTQLLEAAVYAHAGAIGPDEGYHAPGQHGPLGLDDVLVDRHGRVIIELYGLSRGLRGMSACNGETVRDEIRSLVEIGYQLITGLRAEEPLIPAGRLVKRLDPRWDAWLEAGLDATAGFATALEALQTLPSRIGDEVAGRPVAGVVGVLRRLRTVRR